MNVPPRGIHFRGLPAGQGQIAKAGPDPLRSISIHVDDVGARIRQLESDCGEYGWAVWAIRSSPIGIPRSAAWS